MSAISVAAVLVLAESVDYRVVIVGLYSEVCLTHDPNARHNKAASDPKFIQDSEAIAWKTGLQQSRANEI